MKDSIFFRIDVTASAAFRDFNRNDYSSTLSWIHQYESGCSDYDAGRYNPQELALTALYSSMWGARITYQLAKCHCFLQLNQWEDALNTLEKTDFSQLCREPELPLRCLSLLSRLSEKSPRAQALCTQLLAPLWETNGSWAEQSRNECLAAIDQIFRDRRQNQCWRLFLQVPGDLGWAARCLEAVEPEGVAAALSNIHDWSRVPVQTLLYALEVGAPLPDTFYQQGEERLRNMAAMAANDPTLPLCLLRWTSRNDFSASLAQRQFIFQLAAAAARGFNWKDKATSDGLCNLFIDVSTGYFSSLYNSELLACKDGWVALPGLHRCALYLMRAHTVLKSGDELGYVHALRAGLDAAPAMKHMIEFMLHQRPTPHPTPELLELAQKIQAILAQYPANDPAVAAIKASPAYQKVASYLETDLHPSVSKSIGRMPIDLLDEALAGSKEEISASIQQHLTRWGTPLLQRRVLYWEEFPLWGKTRQEVVNNISNALYSNKENFRWIFNRLEDKQSQCILTAVVRSWRYYERQPLEQLKETRYDDYFDLSLLHCSADEVVADLGAYVGDTFLSYIKNYGSLSYSHYYCYEITSDSFRQLLDTTRPYPRVICRRKGVGAGPDTMYLAPRQDSSANTLEVSGEEQVEIVALDDDITEPLTLIKMDIEGAEQAALEGCLRHIREDRPKLALSVYHNFEDIWKLAKMVDESAPGYCFYLRYHGGDLWPSEITLLAIPRERS